MLSGYVPYAEAPANPMAPDYFESVAKRSAARKAAEPWLLAPYAGDPLCVSGWRSPWAARRTAAIRLARKAWLEVAVAHEKRRLEQLSATVAAGKPLEDGCSL